MFVVLVYDIRVKRVSKIMKICRKYLQAVQKSVYEGNLTESQLKRLKEELRKCICIEEDSIIIYRMDSVKYTRKELIGQSVSFSNIL